MFTIMITLSLINRLIPVSVIIEMVPGGLTDVDQTKSDH